MSINTRKYVYTSPADKLYMAIVYSFTIIICLIILIPLIFVISASFSSPDALLGGRVFLWPVDFGFQGYKEILRSERLLVGFRNTAFYASFGTFINVILTILCAYPLSRKDLKPSGTIMFILTFTMLFNGGMIPTYLLVRNLNLIDTVWAMVLPNAMGVWNVIIMRTYFQHSVPFELYESASIDGCDDFRFLAKIAVPLATPIIAVQVLLYAVGHWNSFFNALLYLQSARLFPLQMVLRDILLQNDMASINTDAGKLIERQRMRYLLQYSTIVVSTVPVMLLYPFIQKYFVTGIMIGSIKG